MRLRLVCCSALLAIAASACGGTTESDAEGAATTPASTPESSILETAAPESSISETAAPESSIPETAAPETAATQRTADGIGYTTIDFVDPTRATDEVSADDEVLVEAADSRLLQTTVRYPATEDGEGAAPVADHLPLIILSHGLSGTPEYVTPLADVLVEAGYVVALPLYPESSVGGAADFVEQPADVSFIIDQLIELSDGTDGEFSGTIDAERIGAAGHSLGAFTTAGLAYNECCIDESVDAAALLAGLAVPYGQNQYTWPDTPLLLIHGDADGVIGYSGSTEMAAAAQGPTYFLTMLGVDHGAGLWNDEHNPLLNEALVAFFDEYVAGVDNDLAAIESADGLSTWATSNL